MKPGSLVRYKPQFEVEGMGLVLSEPLKLKEQPPATLRPVVPRRWLAAKADEPDYVWISFLWNGKVCWEYVESLEVVE